MGNEDPGELKWNDSCEARTCGLCTRKQRGLEPKIHRNRTQLFGLGKRVYKHAHVVAGEEGFEPPNGGSKGRCLTTWLLPNADTRVPYHLRMLSLRDHSRNHHHSHCLPAGRLSPV